MAKFYLLIEPDDVSAFTTLEAAQEAQRAIAERLHEDDESYIDEIEGSEDEHGLVYDVANDRYIYIMIV